MAGRLLDPDPLPLYDSATAYTPNWRDAMVGMLKKGASNLTGGALFPTIEQRKGLQDAKSVIPEVSLPAKKEMYANALMGAFNPSHVGMAGITTYHGTPHTFLPEPGFPQGRFRLDKIGTGEGTQVRGRGIYVAEHPDVATEYHPLTFNVESTRPIEAHEADAWSKAYVTMTQQKGDQAAAIKSLERQREIWQKKADRPTDASAVQWQLPRIEQAIDLIRSGVAKAKTNEPIYTQDLPDKMLPRMLQWDKPLGEQPESVQMGLKKMRIGDSDITAGELINNMNPADHAEFAKYGIPGVTYFPTSPNAKGTRNHVVWDQNLLDQMAPARYE